MKVYHGGTETVEFPDISKGRAGLDFGQGFYVTYLNIGFLFKKMELPTMETTTLLPLLPVTCRPQSLNRRQIYVLEIVPHLQ